MHGVGTGAAGDTEDLLDDEIRLGARGPIERVRFVGEPRVQRITILIGVDGDRGDAAVTSSTNDAHGDLAAVRDEDFAEF